MNLSNSHPGNMFPGSLDITKLLGLAAYVPPADPTELIIRHQIASQLSPLLTSCFTPTTATSVISSPITTVLNSSVQPIEESFSISKLIENCEMEKAAANGIKVINQQQDSLASTANHNNNNNNSLADSASTKLITELLRSLTQTSVSPDLSFNSTTSSPIPRIEESSPVPISIPSLAEIGSKPVFPDLEATSPNSVNTHSSSTAMAINDNESNSSSVDSNGNKIDVNWLRNLIRTAGAVIKPGKPTSFFQLRQRRDSAEITSLAKDLESRKKRFVCTFPNCTKAYYKRSHLKEHSYIHTGDKPYMCSHSDCGARFTRADQLSRHRRAHTGERNFCCLVCSKRFKRSDHLKVHLARHAGQQFDNSFLPSLTSSMPCGDSSKENSAD